MTTEAPVETKRPNRLGVAAATLLAVIAAASLSQALTYAFYGIAAEFNTTWAPGLLTFVAAFWMAAAVKSWASWRRWIWLPVGIAAALSVAMVVLEVNVAQAVAEEEEKAAHARMCSDARAELGGLIATHDALVDEANALQGSFATDGEPPTPLTQGMTDWAEFAGEGSIAAAWDRYATYGGPEMAADIETLEAGIAAECD